MGLAGFFQHRDKKGGGASGLGMWNICDLLHSLAPIGPEANMARKHISCRRLELVCDDGANDCLVLDEFEVGRPPYWLVRHGAGKGLTVPWRIQLSGAKVVRIEVTTTMSADCFQPNAEQVAASISDFAFGPVRYLQAPPKRKLLDQSLDDSRVES